jgi:lipopolysaccharide export system permease protein
MTIFTKSILKEYIATCCMLLAALILIVLVTQLVRYLGYAISAHQSLSAVSTIYLLSSIKNLPVILSLSVALTVTIVIGRCYRDSEMAIWSGSGQSILHWIMPTSLFAFPIACLAAVFTLSLAPWAERSIEERKNDLESREDISAAPPGVFIESRSGNAVFFIDSLDRETGDFSGLFVYTEDEGLISIVSAGSGQSGGPGLSSEYLVAENGSRYDIDYRSDELHWTQFAKYGVHIDRRVGAKAFVHQSGKSTSTLFSEPSLDNLAELVWRIGLPVSTVVLALLCLSISFERTRGGRSYSIGLGMLMFLIYKNTLAIFETQVFHGNFAPWQGFVLPHLLALLISLMILILRAGRLRVYGPKWITG